MAYDQALAERITDFFTAKKARFHSKAMMGGLCFMVDDKMCVGVVGDRLMARLDPADEATMLKRPGCRPMDFTGRPMKGYVFVDAEGMDAEADLRFWLQRALDFNPKAKASAKKKKA